MKRLICLLLLLFSVATYAFKEGDFNRIIESANSLTNEDIENLQSIKSKDLDVALFLVDIINNDKKQIKELDSIRSKYTEHDKNLLYLTDSISIFTTPLPDSTEVSPALRPLIRAISTVKTYKQAINEINIIINETLKELGDSKNRYKTPDDLFKSESVQTPLTYLIDANIAIEALDLSLFSAEQRKYITELQEQYNEIIKNYFI